MQDECQTRMYLIIPVCTI